MKVNELNKEQLEELKIDYFYNKLYCTNEQYKYDFFIDIPDEVIFEEYGCFDFVNDDFCCTCANE